MVSISGCANRRKSVTLHSNVPICSGFRFVGRHNIEDYRKRGKSSLSASGQVNVAHWLLLVGRLPQFERNVSWFPKHPK